MEVGTTPGTTPGTTYNYVLEDIAANSGEAITPDLDQAGYMVYGYYDLAEPEYTEYWGRTDVEDAASGNLGVLSAYIPGALAPMASGAVQAAKQLTYRTPSPTLTKVFQPTGLPNPQVAPQALPEVEPWGEVMRATSHYLFEAAELGGVLVDLLVIMDPRTVVPGVYGRPQVSPEM
jgi:hypothetical protein